MEELQKIQEETSEELQSISEEISENDLPFGPLAIKVRTFLTSFPVILTVIFLCIGALTGIAESIVDNTIIMNILGDDFGTLTETYGQILASFSVAINVVLSIMINAPKIALIMLCIGFIMLIAGAHKARTCDKMSSSAFTVLHVVNVFFVLYSAGLLALGLLGFIFLLICESFLFFGMVIILIGYAILATVICGVILFLYILKNLGLGRSLITLAAVVNGSESRKHISSPAAVMTIVEGVITAAMILSVGSVLFIISLACLATFQIMLGINMLRLKKLMV